MDTGRRLFVLGIMLLLLLLLEVGSAETTSFKVRDSLGRPLFGVEVKVTPMLMRQPPLVEGSSVTLLGIPEGVIYTFEMSWTSPDYGSTATLVVRDSPAGLASREVINLPVGDVVVTVLDTTARPVTGATLKLAGVEGKTDGDGRAIFSLVPLESGGAGITYNISVEKDGTRLAEESVTFSLSKTTHTIVVEIYDVVALVKGSAGQPLFGADVTLLRANTPLQTQATGPDGLVTFSRVMAADYEVRAVFGGFADSKTIRKGERTVTLNLDIYTFIGGVPLTFTSFVALIVGIIVLVVVVAVVVFEINRWRGRRLGVYPVAAK